MRAPAELHREQAGSPMCLVESERDSVLSRALSISCHASSSFADEASGRSFGQCACWSVKNSNARSNLRVACAAPTIQCGGRIKHLARWGCNSPYATTVFWLLDEIREPLQQRPHSLVASAQDWPIATLTLNLSLDLRSCSCTAGREHRMH